MDKYNEYKQTLEQFSKKEREAEQALRDNRSECEELKKRYVAEVENGGDTTKIKLAINELDGELEFLLLEAEAFHNPLKNKKLLQAQEAAAQEQQKLLFDSIDEFDHLEEKFNRLRDGWLDLVVAAYSVRKRSQQIHARLSELVEPTGHQPTAGNRINLDTESGFIFFNNQEVKDVYRKGKK